MAEDLAASAASIVVVSVGSTAVASAASRVFGPAVLVAYRAAAWLFGLAVSAVSRAYGPVVSAASSGAASLCGPAVSVASRAAA